MQDWLLQLLSGPELPHLLQVMALQAQLALKDAEVAAAAAQLDASAGGQAFTPIPVGLTRLNALATGSGDTGSQRGESGSFLFLSAAVALSEGPARVPCASSIFAINMYRNEGRTWQVWQSPASSRLWLAGCCWLLLSPSARDGAEQIESCCSCHT